MPTSVNTTSLPLAANTVMGVGNIKVSNLVYSKLITKRNCTILASGGQSNYGQLRLKLKGQPIDKLESSFVYNSDTPSEINHDVLFREGLTPSGYVTYTPRLLLVDLKGSLGHLPEKGELYEQPLANPEIVPWPREKVEVLTEPTTTKNEFLQDIDEENVMDQDDGHTSKTVVQDALKVYKLENVVKVWADYLRQRFHPRTVSIVNKYEHANDSQPFNNYKLGANLWNTEQFEEDFTDKIRNLVEECDNMQ
ncbi:unnamed protein product, partial [Timema podura]|nr:unnamed protein product [Timema podura]